MAALVRARRRGPLGFGVRGTRWPGRSSAWRMSARLSSWLPACARRPARCCWCSPPGARLSAYIGATVGEIGFLRGFWMDGSRRLAWLEDYAASAAASADLPVPGALHRGIRFDHVSFAYPGTSRVVLDDVSMTLPAGAVVAIVGENGAGKTTLVKLLAKMYEPSSGSIFVDETSTGASARRRLACTPRRRVPGFFPVRISRGAHRRSGRCPQGRRPARGRGRRGARRAPATSSRAYRGSRHPTRSDVARRRGTIVRPVAETRPRARLHARRAAPPHSRRTHRGLGRGDGTRPVRALRGGSSAQRPAAAAAASPSSFPTASPPSEWPTSSSCSTAPGSWKSARTRN